MALHGIYTVAVWVFYSDLDRPAMWERSVCTVTCWHLCVAGLRCLSVWVKCLCFVLSCFYLFFISFLQVLHWCAFSWFSSELLLSFSPSVFTNTLRWSLHTENKMITIVNCGCGLAPTPPPLPHLLILWMSSNCPSHPSNQHPSKKHNQSYSQVKQRACPNQGHEEPGLWSPPPTAGAITGLPWAQD